MHVCLVGVEYPKDTSFGGIATYQYLLSKELVKSGNKVTVICGTDKDDYDYYEDNIHVIRLHTIRNEETVETYYNYRKKIKKIINEINKKDPIDIVETPEFSAEIIEFLKNRNIPVVVKLHTSYNIWSIMNKTSLPQKLHKEIIKNEDLVIKYADKVICCSEILKPLMPKYHQIDDINKIEVVGNPINTNDFYPLENAHNSKKILFCGSLEKRKGIFVLVKAIPLIVDYLKDDDIKFQFIGNYLMKNSKGENVKQQIYNLLAKKYHKYIEFLGQIDNKDLNKYFNEARIGVIPSLFDNLPYVAMEQLLTELPIVASNNTGIREMITDNESGILYDPLDYKELANKVINLFLDKELSKKCGKNGRCEILKKYSPDVIAKQNIAIYKEAIREFNEKKEIKDICDKLNLKNIKEMKNGGANYVIKCKYNNKDVIVKFYHKLKNYNYDLIKYVLDKDINCNKLIDFYSFKTYKVGIFSYIKGKMHRYFSKEQINQIFLECKKINVQIESNICSNSIYDKVYFYYKKLKNIDNPIIKDIIRKYKELNIVSSCDDVIIHGDLSYKNIIWNKKAYLIDFDEVMKGPFEYEAASFLIKNCFDNGYFDVNYSKKIISYYRSHNFNLNKIREYYYFFIIKVLLEKFYYNQLYALNLESDSQKKDYWLWWYKLLKNEAIVHVLFDFEKQDFVLVKELKNDFKSRVDVLEVNSRWYVRKYSKNSNLQYTKNEQDILCNLGGYINVIPLLHYYKNKDNYIVKYYPYVDNRKTKISDDELIKNVYKLSLRLEEMSKYIPCKNETLLNKLNLLSKTIKDDEVRAIVKLMIDDKDLHEEIDKENKIIIHDDLNDTNIIVNNEKIYFMDFDNLKKYPKSMQLASFLTLYYLCNYKDIPWDIVLKYFEVDMNYFNKLVEFILIRLYNYFENIDLNLEDKKRMDLVYKLIKEYGKIYERN